MESVQHESQVKYLTVEVGQERNEVRVRYGDLNGFFAPLEYMYHSSESRSLVSMHPLSMQQEVAALYCPNLCGPGSFFGIQADMSGGYGGRCARCFSCPVCETTLAYIPMNRDGTLEYCLSCPYCSWDSVKVDLVGPSAHSIQSLALEIENQDPLREYYDNLLSAVTANARTVSEGASENSYLKGLLKSRTTNSRYRLSTHEIEIDFEPGLSAITQELKQIESRCARVAESWMLDSNRGGAMALELGQKLMPLPTPKYEVNNEIGISDWSKESWQVEDGGCIASTKQLIAAETGPVTTEAWNQLNGKFSGGRVNSRLFPRRVPYRSKMLLRCIADVNAGKPGIMSKPEVNPESGDSSQMTSHGRWWKKDNSAVKTVPAITVAALPVLVNRTYVSIILRLTNPVDSMVTVKLCEALCSVALNRPSENSYSPTKCVPAKHESNSDISVQIGPAENEYIVSINEQVPPSIPRNLLIDPMRDRESIEVGLCKIHEDLNSMWIRSVMHFDYLEDLIGCDKTVLVVITCNLFIFDSEKDSPMMSPVEIVVPLSLGNN